MPQPQIEYAAMLAELEARRNSLGARVSGIDEAIDNIRKLLSLETQSPSRARYSANPAVPARAVEPSVRRAPEQQQSPTRIPVQTQAATALSSERRRKPGLNIYVNRYPEWSRQMSRGNLTFRKKAGARCPKCGSADTRKSETNGLSNFFALLFGYGNARCRNCNCRFRIRNAQQPREFAHPQTAQAE